MEHPALTMRRALLLLSVLLATLFALRQAGWISSGHGVFTAIDGDSLRKDGVEYRLSGIDAPELRQDCRDGRDETYACGREAKNALGRLASGRALDCAVIETDRYARLVAICRAGETEVNAEMVRLGWAIAYRKHSYAYVAEEAAAQEASRGLWQGEFERPEDWRERHRKALARGDVSGSEIPDD